MSRDDLKPFSYVILALVGEGGAGPHDIVRMMRAGSRQYWTTSESHFYAEPKRLAELGYLAAEATPGRTRQRTQYTLTDAGREALREWAREPTPFPRIQSEAVIRLLAGDVLADDAALLASLDSLRTELDELEAATELAAAAAAEIPHRTRYLLLVHDFGRRLVRAHREWLAAVERELEG
ncbi:MAG: PadR family transcriptional regulator [Solirubrobacterales bacterium]